MSVRNAAVDFTVRSVAVILAAGSLACAFSDAGGVETALAGSLSESEIDLAPCAVGRGRDEALCGTHEVWEDREAQRGRRIALDIVVLPALDPRPGDTPVFYLAGGPGGAATDSARGMSRSWMREHHDMVLVDQRGTGDSNPLDCQSASPDSLQGYLSTAFGSAEHFSRCRERLEQIADLRLYTTPIAMDDLNEVRQALGYDKIYVYGGSYGSRATLVYLRRHPETVRGAIITGIAPIAFTNPLYHAREAQNALDKTFAVCAGDAACNRAFPDLGAKLDEVLARLEAEPAIVEVRHPRSGANERISLGREAFADGLRVFSYFMPRARRVPLLVQRAWEGNFEPVAQTLLESSFGLSALLQMGMLMSVTCVEDVARIHADDIATATDGTYLGDSRVRQQIEACQSWPLGRIDESYGDPVAVDVPVLLWSGTMDPVTGPRWGEEAVSHLPRGLHLVVPGAHGVAGPCVNDISRQFLDSGSVEGLETSCIAGIRLPPFDLR